MDIGYSDHSLGNLASISAVALGATIIEKHFTINKKLKGPDHKASANYNELKRLFSNIRKLEVSLGDGNKKPHIKELDTANVQENLGIQKKNS